jgi:4-hydroxy-tetrahydrodipicolinate reductase
MNSPTAIVMFGAGGRMGRMILELAACEPERYQIAGAVEHAQHPLLGQALVQFIPGGPVDVKLSTQPPVDAPTDAVGIHFSSPVSTLEHLRWGHGRHAAVVGTTGLNADQTAQLQTAAADLALLHTPNTSTGVNVLFWLAEQAAQLLGPDYDLEIVEMHHHHKADAPSGTAKRLAEVVLAARGGDYERDVRHGRQGVVGARTPGELGMHAVRGGDVVGDHTLYLAAAGERLELTHRASSRETFARGALRCAGWMLGKAPGSYTMKDVLGL